MMLQLLRDWYVGQANIILLASLQTSERPTLRVSAPLPNDPHLRYVLCFLRHNRHHPYVTWYENMQDTIRNKHPVYYEGDYCISYDEGVQSFFRRINRRQALVDRTAPALTLHELGVGLIEAGLA